MELWHTFLEPTWFWDGRSETAHRGVGVYIRGREYVGMKLPSFGMKLSAAHIPMKGMLVTPGWVNFHCHLELSKVPRPPYEGKFVNWLGHVMAKGPKDGNEADAGVQFGAAQLLRSGTTEVVDITRWPRHVRPSLKLTGLRVRSCAEVTGLAAREERGADMIAAGTESQTDCDHRVTPGFSPHAVYSTSGRWFSQCAQIAARDGLTLTTHLCETPAEREFLTSHTGPFRKLWDVLGGWQEGVQQSDSGPVMWMAAQGIFVNTSLLAAHVNDVTDEELSILAENKVTIVHCPRTHAYFQRPPFDLQRYRRAGVTVKLGTDSAASCGDLDMLAEARLFADQNPDLGWAEVVSMIMDGPVVEGAKADFAVWRVETDDPVRELRERQGMQACEIWVGGERVWGKG